jgi:phenylacetate-CoA ligase
MPIWDRKTETVDREAMQQMQLERLQTTVNRAFRNVPFYHRKLEQLGIEPEEVLALGDVRKLPFTLVQDLRDAYPYEMFAVPLKEIVRIDSFAAAPGRPLVMGYTARDVSHWAELGARMMSAAGVTREDVVQVAAECEALVGGFGTHYGVERLGASLIPAGGSTPERQVRIMQDFRSTALVSTPSHAQHIMEAMRTVGVSADDLCLRVGLFGTEPMTARRRAQIESQFGIVAAANYGISSVTGPGIAAECEIKDGLHIQEDHFLVEVVDPLTLEPLPPGQPGEIVITTLAQEGLPLIRFRTRDVSSVTYEPCRCGRTTARMSTVTGRTDGAVSIRGMHVYPEDIQALLYDIEHVEPHYQIVVDSRGGLDVLTVRVELSSALISDQMNKIMALEETIRQRISLDLGLTVDVKLVEPQTLRDVPEGKRVIDNRER